MVASIEYIERVVALYRQAAEANRQTPSRVGNELALTPDHAEEVMITGDLHGHRANFNAIQRIANLEACPHRHLILQEVCHGGPTYPSNGGCMSHALLEDVAKLKVRYPAQVHFLLGNHELAELTDFPILKGQRMLNLYFRYGLQEIYGPATEKVREAYRTFLSSCPLVARLPGNLLVSHSLPERLEQEAFDQTILGRALELADYSERGAVFSMLWGRDYRSENADIFARLVGANVLIHGHDPCPEGYKVPNGRQIILDCSSSPAAYLLLPTTETLSHGQIVDRIERLP